MIAPAPGFAREFTFGLTLDTAYPTMADDSPSFDLRLTPDWVKEGEPANRYADYEGEETGDTFSRRRGRRDERPRRPGSPSERNRREGSRPGPARNVRSGSPRSAESASTGLRPPQGVRSRREESHSPRPELELAPVQVDFLPEERAFAKIIEQIKQGHTAYPLFGLARMFLERPERHRIRIRSLDNASMLYQLGDLGAVALEASALERIAFQEKRDEFYQTEVIEKEPVKGVFTSVARCTLSGKLLGPTNYHAFQPTIRALYEQRFSRRMTFEDYRRTIEITSNPASVNQWKDEARKTINFRTRNEEPASVFPNLSGVEQHFRTHYLPALIKPCLAAEIPGDLARHLPDRRIVASIRVARDRENRFPAQIAGALRHGLNQAGLHVFKHKKRILYISTIRPQAFDPSQASISAGLAAILATLRSFPKITRKQLAEKILPKEKAEKDEGTYQRAKAVLVGDLLWLAKAGHVIEFADGTLDLPLPPKPLETHNTSAGTTEAPSQATREEPDEPDSETSADTKEADSATTAVAASSAQSDVQQAPSTSQAAIEPGPPSAASSLAASPEPATSSSAETPAGQDPVKTPDSHDPVPSPPSHEFAERDA